MLKSTEIPRRIQYQFTCPYGPDANYCLFILNTCRGVVIKKGRPIFMSSTENTILISASRFKALHACIGSPRLHIPFQGCSSLPVYCYPLVPLSTLQHLCTGPSRPWSSSRRPSRDCRLGAGLGINPVAASNRRLGLGARVSLFPGWSILCLECCVYVAPRPGSDALPAANRAFSLRWPYALSLPAVGVRLHLAPDIRPPLSGIYSSSRISSRFPAPHLGCAVAAEGGENNKQMEEEEKGTKKRENKGRGNDGIITGGACRRPDSCA